VLIEKYHLVMGFAGLSCTCFPILFTVVVLFAFQSRSISSKIGKIGKVVYAALPLIVYFLVMFVASFQSARYLGGTYPQCVNMAFTAARSEAASFGLL
jgi:arsenite transporter